MRKVVSNTTPILSLIKIDKLDILKNLYNEIIIPRAVFNEIEKGKSTPFYTDLSKKDWIKIVDITDSDSLKYLADIDAGEAEIIVLGLEIEADLVIMDEILGRKFANYFDLTITGTLGVLLKAKEQGLIDSIKSEISELKKKGTWINKKLIDRILLIANEK